MAEDYQALWKASANVIRQKSREILKLKDGLLLVEMENEGLIFYIAGEGTPEWREYVKTECERRLEERSKEPDEQQPGLQSVVRGEMRGGGEDARGGAESLFCADGVGRTDTGHAHTRTASGDV